ncbi:nucleotide sugar dehydrogenase [Thermoleophilia bacterium SCSIO 60948]|nr:nucleotide sugar dehydrogenase [Thermoleophilia bacterium SCSIO 60948]
MRVGIIGLGYVGLPLAVEFAEAGVDVVGVDVSAERVERLTRSESDIEDIPSERLAGSAERLRFSTDYAALSEADAVLICVPTPLTLGREPDLSYVTDATERLAEVLSPGALVVLESTTYPGTTRERLAPILERAGHSFDSGLGLAFSPERIDPGRSDHTLRTTPKVVGGMTPGCTERAAELYRLVCDEVVSVSSPEVAEMTKLLENIYRAVNIALVNELAQLTDRMGISIWEVVEAAATKPFGFQRFDPGPGMGGHCLPVDPFYLSYLARRLDSYTEFVELAGKLNQTQPHWCVDLIERALNERSLAVRGAKVLIIGVAYKGGVGDLRESPALKIIEELQALGAEVSYSDPHVSELERFSLSSRSLTGGLDDCDLAVIVTAHPGIDWERVAEAAPLLLDLRGVTRDVESENVRRLGEGF